MSYDIWSVVSINLIVFVFFFKQQTAYEMRISDWSSDVCSSDLAFRQQPVLAPDEQVHPAPLVEQVLLLQIAQAGAVIAQEQPPRVEHRGVNPDEIGRASCRERVCQYV